MSDRFRQLLAPLARRIRLSVGLALVDLVDDTRRLQKLQCRSLGGGVPADLNRYQNYGFTSVPLPGAQAVLVAVGGNASHLVALAVDDARYRMKDLLPGESALHNHLGDFIVIRNGRIVEINAGAALQVTAPEATFNCETKVTLNTPLLEVSGDISAGGSVSAAAAVSAGTTVSDASGSMQEMRGVHNDHGHAAFNTPPTELME